MNLHKQYSSANILNEIKAYELQNFLIKFYDDLKKEREWDLYVVAWSHGEKRDFEKWRTPIKPIQKKSKEEVETDLQLISMSMLT